MSYFVFEQTSCLHP